MRINRRVQCCTLIDFDLLESNVLPAMISIEVGNSKIDQMHDIGRVAKTNGYILRLDISMYDTAVVQLFKPF